MAPKNPNDTHGRTNVISDDMAMQIAAAQSQQAKKRTRGGGGFKLSRGRGNPGSSRSNATSSSAPLKAPHSGQKSRGQIHTSNDAARPAQKPTWRSNHTMKSLTRKTVDDLYEIVRKRGGTAKEKEFRESKATKGTMARWILDVESINTGDAAKDIRNDGLPANTSAAGPGLPSSIANLSNKRQRVGNPTASEQQTVKKPKTRHTNFKHPTSPQISKGAPVKQTQLQTTSLGDDRSNVDTDEIQRLLLREFYNDPEPLTSPGSMSPGIGRAKFKGKSAERDRNIPTLKYVERRPKKVNDKHLVDRHPTIDALGLNPDPHAAPLDGTRTVRLKRNLVVVSAVPSRYGLAPHLHETTIPKSDLTKIHKEYTTGEKEVWDTLVPHLKPGKHGWDDENHCWAWEGDPDLEAGVGHQVELADQERLDWAGAAFEKEFFQKYPGRRGNQWPCGCQLPWNDSDSEEE
ncbi:hypothetical protein CC80DRAFT_584515 [Byssothecium circinans]|uniref:Uncharacterized protein n=1 Tax=Byssothecium circinans TaxID=147558 RepID=A0A6A5U4R5_9PLEO|nr:hypothetical protein CC80DRAFT_584515 [Byssothecium circinans]